MKRAALALCAAVAVSACATITRGTTEDLVIASDPAGAVARLSTGQQCETPCVLRVARRGDVGVTVEKEGYETVRTTVASEVDAGGVAGMAGNVVGAGVVGAVVDARSGAMRSLRPNPLVVELTPAAGR